MPCFHPLTAYKLAGQIKFGLPSSSLAEPLKLPCGRCIGCRLERSRQWAARMMFESQLHDDNCAITLTFDEEHLPDPPSLNVRDLQLFFKRLRERIKPQRVRFYAVGEYGDKSFRPHYHACLFGYDFPDKVLYARSATDNDLYSSELLDSVWSNGRALINNLSFESAAYCARYCLKKVNGDYADEHYRWVDHETGELTNLKPEFAVMSRKPGIGGRWYDLYSSDVYNGHDYVVVNGRRVRPPKYFDRRLERDDPERFAEIKAARKTAAKTERQSDVTPERLAVREEVAKARLNLLVKRSTL